MPATIGEILKTKPELVTTTPDTLLSTALEDIIRYDYSQLPVIDTHEKPVGMITSDSIVRALHHFNLTAREAEKPEQRQQQLRVVDAMLRQIATCGPEDDVFVVLKYLRDISGVLVLDGAGKLIGIVTSYDTTEYLRQRVQDIVLVQDIEEMIKDYIRLAFKQSDGSDNRPALDAAIVKIMSSTDALKGFKKALSAYLQAAGTQPQIDGNSAQTAFDQHLARKPEAFEKLSLNEYIQILLHDDRWLSYRQVLQVDRDAIRQLLVSVRDTRNDLAHLRIDITARQRDELRFCRDWLKHYYEPLKATLAPALTTVDQVVDDAADQLVSGETSTDDEGAAIPVVDEMPLPGASRYAPLADWLYGYPTNEERTTFSFTQIERIIGGSLPDSARDNRSWWSNDSAGHTQSRLWLGAGWRVDEVDLAREKVTFTRMKERERAYVDFFSALFDDLRQTTTFAEARLSRVGVHLQPVTPLPHNPPYAGLLNFAFTRARRPRVDLYIDTGKMERNKQIFDLLSARREAVEAAFGGQLTWERIDDKRASRIAVYYDDLVSVDASPRALAQLRKWAVDALVRMHSALEVHVHAVMADITVDHSPHNGSSARSTHR
jgi:predicted transcriptional regulator